MHDVEGSFQIAKMDPDRRLVFGWAWVAEENGQLVFDDEGDAIPSDELEKAVYQFALDSREAGEIHFRQTGVGRLVESIVFTKAKCEALGIDPPEGRYGWWVGFHVDDDDVWTLAKSGVYPAFSIGGKGVRHAVQQAS